MDYDQRITHIKSWFKAEIARRFSMPKDLDPITAATDVVEAINSSLPANLTAEKMTSFLQSILKEVSRNARSRTLPIPKDFIDAAGKVAKARSGDAGAPSNSASYLDTLKITEARVRAGEPVGDTWLRGTMRQRLLDNTALTENDLAPYDSALACGAHMQ